MPHVKCLCWRTFSSTYLLDSGTEIRNKGDSLKILYFLNSGSFNSYSKVDCSFCFCKHSVSKLQVYAKKKGERLYSYSDRWAFIDLIPISVTGS